MLFVPKTKFFWQAAAAMLVARRFLPAAVRQVAVPENWGFSDSIGYAALVVIFAFLVRRRVLRRNKF